MKVVDVGKTDPSWRNYVEYLNEMVVLGFTNVVRHSLEYLVRYMEGRVKDEIPLLELKLELQDKMLLFSPDIDGGTCITNGYTWFDMC